MRSLAVILAIVLGAIPPLTPEQQARLDTAYDGRDHQEEAFVALLEHVRGWAGAAGDEPVRLSVDVARLVEQADERRGQLHQIRGELHQRWRLREPFEDVEEWSVRLPDGTAVLVYLPFAAAEVPRDGDEIELLARFYKRIDTAGRDGTMRSYAAFVGASPKRLSPAVSADAWSGPWLLLVIVVVLVTVFLVLLGVIRQPKRSTHRAARAPLNVEVADPHPLPDDPAEALAELRRRAGPRS